jgi:hypothetical protein
MDIVKLLILFSCKHSSSILSNSQRTSLMGRVVISDAAFRLTTAWIICFCIFLESDSCVWLQFPLMISEECSSVLILPLQFFTVHRHDISPDFKTYLFKMQIHHKAMIFFLYSSRTM